MHSARKMTAIAGAALSALVVAGLLLVPSGAALAGPPEPRELPGLREAPDIPVASIFLRRALPGHPLPPSVEREFPGPDAPGLEGRPPPGGGGCDKDVDLDPTGAIDGVVAVAAQDNGFCTNADIDTYVVDDGTKIFTYVVQAGGEEGAWTHTDVSDPSNPAIVNQFVWDGPAGRSTYTPDIKAFSQGSRDYIVLALERMKVRAFCGVVIVDVTDLPLPANAPIVSQFIGADWCDVHNVFVENGADGDGKYIYATADSTNDLRVLDISGENVVDCVGCVTNPVEIGRYTAPGANNDNYVHDVTVLYHSALDALPDDDGRRVYLSYWASGLIILNASEVTQGTPGINPIPVVGPNSSTGYEINPDNFLTHHAWASEDGSVVFLEDEILDSMNDEPVQMWNATDGTYVDGLVLGTDVPVNPAHNLEIRYDIDPNRLYVAWYKLGLQAWDFDSAGFLPPVSPAPPAVFHQVQTEAADDDYSGAWGVRLEMITVAGIELLYIFQSDRNFGLIVDCEDCTAVTGKVTDISTGLPIKGASVVANTGQSATTDVNGDYTLSDVPTGTRTVTASADGYVTQQDASVVVTLGVTTSGVDFELDLAGGGTTGTITGTVTDSGGSEIGGASVSADTGLGDTTNADGIYELTGVETGTTTVTASAADFVTQEITGVGVTEDGPNVVDFVLVPVPTGGGTGTIKGTVRDGSTGDRLRDVTVTTNITEGSVTTNRRGMYSIKNVPAGDVTVTAEADDFLIEQIFNVEVLNGQTTAGVDFELVPN